VAAPELEVADDVHEPDIALNWEDRVEGLTLSGTGD
jgi:hypothetical protein